MVNGKSVNLVRETHEVLKWMVWIGLLLVVGGLHFLSPLCFNIKIFKATITRFIHQTKSELSSSSQVSDLEYLFPLQNEVSSSLLWSVLAQAERTGLLCVVQPCSLGAGDSGSDCY